MAKHWYALHSKPNMESMLWYQLQVRGLDTYYPRLRVKPVNPRSRTEVPYFPGYLFAHLDFDETPISQIAWVPGMQRIVAFDGEPAWLPDPLMQALQNQVEAANRIARDPLGGLRSGDPVRIQSGPFAGYEAIFDSRLNGSERARVLVLFLRNRQLPLEVPLGQLRPASQRR